MQRLISAINLFVAVFGLWRVASGPYSLPGLTAEGSWMILLVGLASSVGVVVLSHRLGIVDRENVPLHWTPRTSIYICWLAWRVVESSLDVMRRIWLGGQWIDPAVVSVKASQETDVGRATYANSITLTPGTVTIDVAESLLTVHTIAREVAEGLESGPRAVTDHWVYWVEQGSRLKPGREGAEVEVEVEVGGEEIDDEPEEEAVEA